MESKLSYHEVLKTLDLASLVAEAVRKNQFVLESDGRLRPNVSINLDSPWHHVKRDSSFDCEKWHSVMFSIIGSKLGQRFVPSPCQQCWKVVVRPKTLKQLFMLLDIQVRLDRHSKCGIEKRKTVNGLYGGYFYNASFEEGMECYRIVRKEIDEHLGEDITVILKRGCTEYELAMGDSKYYQVPKWQEKVEALINEWVVPYESDDLQPKYVLAAVHRSWIEWAYMNGDETYKEYTNGKPLYAPLRTYHHLVDCTDEQIRKFWNIKDTVEEPYNPMEVKND